MVRIVIVMCLAVIMSAVGGSRVAAQPVDPAAREAEARQVYRQGEDAFAQGRYPEALLHFRRGFELSGRSRFLLNIGHTHRLMGDLEQALSIYRQFLDTNPREQDRRHTIDAIAELEAEIGARGSTASSDPPPVTQPFPPQAGDPMLAQTQTDSAQDARPLYQRWYVWVAAGAVLVAGIVVGATLAGDRAPNYVENGSWGRLGPNP